MKNTSKNIVISCIYLIILKHTEYNNKVEHECKTKMLLI